MTFAVWITFGRDLISSPNSGRANTDKTSLADENASPPIVDEVVGGAIPYAFSTDANVAQTELESISHKSLQKRFCWCK